MGDIIPTIALSYSRLSDYRQCPLKFKSKYIDKDYPDESDNPSFVKGTAINKQLENYVKWLTGLIQDKPSLGVHANNMVGLIDKLHASCNGNIHSERQFALDHDWNPCDWFGPPKVVKYRLVVDFLGFESSKKLIVGDFKSGKVRPYEDYPESQLRLTACACFHLFPQVESISTVYWFVEHKKSIVVEFDRSNLEEMKDVFNKAYNDVQMEKEFNHKKNQYCNWCKHVSCPVKV